MRKFSLVLLALVRVAIIVILISVAYQVGRRYLLGDPASWPFDLSELLMLPLTFLAASAVSAHREHVTVDFIAELLPDRARAWLEFVGQVALAVALVALTWFAWTSFLGIFRSGALTGSAYLLIWPAALAVPLGLAAMTIEHGYQSREALQEMVGKYGKGPNR